MARKIYRNGYADGGIVPMGIHNVSSWNFIPNESKKRVLDSFPIMHVGIMELQRQADEQLKRKKKRNVASFIDFLNNNY
jgi:hypothetical protein|tara:strand:+ start:257 stop:493 length:237 start_codon:yes stop_codon:yes gene_type:complete